MNIQWHVTHHMPLPGGVYFAHKVCVSHICKVSSVSDTHDNSFSTSTYTHFRSKNNYTFSRCIFNGKIHFLWILLVEDLTSLKYGRPHGIMGKGNNNE